MWWFLIPLSRAMNVHVCGAWRCLGSKNTNVWREMCVWPEKGTRWWFPTAFVFLPRNVGNDSSDSYLANAPTCEIFARRVFFFLQAFSKWIFGEHNNWWRVVRAQKTLGKPRTRISNLTATKTSKTYKRDGSEQKNTVVAPVKVFFRYHFQVSIFKWKVWWICLISKAVSFFHGKMGWNLAPTLHVAKILDGASKWFEGGEREEKMRPNWNSLHQS